MVFARPLPVSLEDVSKPLPPSRGLITLQEIRDCLAIIAVELLRGRKAEPVRQVVQPAQEPTVRTRRDLSGAIILALGDALAPLTSTQIANLVRASTPVALQALKRLEERGVVAVKRHPYKQWRGRPVNTYVLTSKTTAS